MTYKPRYEWLWYTDTSWGVIASPRGLFRALRAILANGGPEGGAADTPIGVKRGLGRMAVRASVIWADFNGVTRQTVVTTALGGSAIWTAVQAASQAQVATSWESVLASPIGVAQTGGYQSVKVSAQMTFQTASGSIVRLTVPAPSLSIFKADRETVDPTNTLVAAIITAAIGSLADPAGNVVTSYVGGVLQPGRDDLPPVL